VNQGKPLRLMLGVRHFSTFSVIRLLAAIAKLYALKEDTDFDNRQVPSSGDPQFLRNLQD